MHVEAAVPVEPSLHLRRAMSAIVIHHQVQGHLARELTVDAAQEPQKLLVPVTLIAVANDLARQYIERGKQSRRSVSLIVVSPGAASPLFQR